MCVFSAHQSHAARTSKMMDDPIFIAFKNHPLKNFTNKPMLGPQLTNVAIVLQRGKLQIVPHA